MADVRAFRSGNWSDVTATSPWWNGTAIFAPAAGDVVYSNTWTITVDISVTTGTVTNASATSRSWKDGGTATATAGGNYTLNNGVTLYSNIIGASGVSIVNITGSNSASIQGNTSVTQTGNGIGGILHSSTGTLTITGNLSGSGYSFSGGYALNNNSNGAVIITGSVNGGGSSTNYGVNNASTGSVTITVVGFVTGGSVGVGVNNASTGSVTITGNVTGGSGSSGATNASTGIFTIIGDITATNGASGFTSSNSGATNRLSGSFISAANGLSAIYATKYVLWSTPLLAKTRYAKDGISQYVDMFTSDNNPNGGVATTDVRLGVSYGGGLVGTCAVPNAGTVAYGVAVDNTTGTAALTPADVATAVWGAVARTITGGTVTTLTNSPNVPSAASIASQVRTELTSELSKVSALNTDRLAQCATTSIVGNLIAQSNS